MSLTCETRAVRIPTRRTTALALGAGAIAVAVVATATALVPRDGGPDARCPVATQAVDDPAGELVPAAELLPAGSVGDARRPTVEAADTLAARLAPGARVVAGRFFGQAAEVPALVPLGATDRVLFATAPGQVVDRPGGRLVGVELPTGAARWARTLAAPSGAPDPLAPRPGGGLVGDDLVMLLPGTARGPALISLGPADGAVRGCVAVPTAGAGQPERHLVATQTGRDVVVAAAPAAAGVTLSRVTPGQQVRWEHRLTGVGEVGAVDTVAGTALVSRVGHDPVRLAEMAQAGGIAAPTLTAYDVGDGHPTWSFPATDVGTTAASVLDADSETAYVLETGPGRAASVVALDAAGRERWRVRLADGYWDGAVWGPVLVLQGADPRGGAQLRALDLRDGALRWVRRSGPTVPGARRTFGAGVALGSSYVVPAPGGLLRLDPATGRGRVLGSGVPVDAVVPLPGGRWVFLRMGEALFLVDLSGGASEP